MKKDKIKKTLAAAAGMAVVVSSAAGCTVPGHTVRIGSASAGAVYYMVANTLAGLAEDEIEDYEFEVRATTGSVANLRLLSDNYIQLGIAQADIINNAYYGDGQYEGETPLQGYSAIGSLYTEVMQIIVRADSGIESLDELQDKTVSVGAEESGSEQNAEQILAACGLTDGLVKKENMDYTESAKALEEGKIDAIFCTSGLKTTMIDELSRQCDIRFLDIDETVKKKIQGEYPYYLETVIPAETYYGQEKDVSTLGVEAVACVSDKVSDDLAYSLTELLNTKGKELQYATGVTIDQDSSRADSGITIPYHSGALRYYEEQGIQVENTSAG